MGTRGFRVSKDTVARLMREAGYSLQGMSRTLEGCRHEDRDAQFRLINAEIEAAAAAGEPAVSVDGKKKEQLGPYYRQGRSWRPQGDPVKVRGHDFPGRDGTRACPYGVYDIAADRGFVSVGTSNETAAFAVNAIRRWWRSEGALRYPGANRLLVVCDAGGSNACASWLWKHELALLRDETGLEIAVRHFPPGTSKWNKIEHRLFCHLTRTWRARPLMTVEDAVAGIAATVTAAGLKCTAFHDTAGYPTGAEAGSARARHLEACDLDRLPFHGEWNYNVRAVPLPAPEPAPARPGGVPPGTLNHPALTGMHPDGLLELAAALEVPYRAHLERKAFLKRGRRRATAVRSDAPNGNRRLDVAGHVLALRLRDHLTLPMDAIAALLGVDKTTVSHAVALARDLIAEHAVPVPATAPPATPPRSPAQLISRATDAGLTLTIPTNGQPMPEHFKPRQRRTRHDTPETAK